MKHITLLVSALVGALIGVGGMALLSSFLEPIGVLLVAGLVGVVLGVILITSMRLAGFSWGLIVLGFVTMLIVAILAVLAGSLPGVLGVSMPFVINVIGNTLNVINLIFLRDVEVRKN